MNPPRNNQATDLSKLHCPPEVLGGVGVDRHRFIDLHGVLVDLDWWNGKLEDYGLPGRPRISGARDGEVVWGGKATIYRQDLFVLAENACESPEGALAMLYPILAWGTGTKPRNSDRRLKAIAVNPSVVETGLRLAAERSREDARAAFEVLRPTRRKNLVSYLGPAFFTKFLYFAGGGRPEHPCLILDDRVAKSLHDQGGWKSLGTGPWPVETYERYCTLLHRWSREESASGRPLSADELERALFDFKV
jgi:hypothetical protein